MEWKDYTGKLNDHKSYLDMLNRLEDKTVYIEIVLRDNAKPNEIVENFKENTVSTEIVSEWWGTKTVERQKLYRLKSSKEMFEFLKRYETFCKFYWGKDFNERETWIQEDTDFGWDDIAFYNSKNEILLCTTTHECDISVNENLI